MFQLWGQSFTQKPYYDPRKELISASPPRKLEQHRADLSFRHPDHLRDLKTGGYGCLLLIAGMDEESLTDRSSRR